MTKCHNLDFYGLSKEQLILYQVGQFLDTVSRMAWTSANIIK